MNPGTTFEGTAALVESGRLCTIRVPWENGSTASLTVAFPAFNTLYVLQQGFFK
jgi:hypothetical protein